MHCLTEYNEEEIMKMFKEEGEENGENKMGTLVEKLLSLGRTADLQKAATDKDTRYTLYKGFHIV